MKGSVENLIAYGVIMIIFFLGFIATGLLPNAVIAAQASSDSKTAFVLSLFIPFIIAAIIIAFFIRMKGDKPFGNESAW
jgi:glucan phosphoethanolaminetransferase (alkaline phosphatase superfamily)